MADPIESSTLKKLRDFGKDKDVTIQQDKKPQTRYELAERKERDYEEGQVEVNEKGEVEVTGDKIEEIVITINNFIKEKRVVDDQYAFLFDVSSAFTKDNQPFLDEVTRKDVMEMLNNWVDETVSNTYSGVNPRDRMFDNIRGAVFKFFLEGGPNKQNIAFNPEQYNKQFALGTQLANRSSVEYDPGSAREITEVKRDQIFRQQLFNNALIVAKQNSENIRYDIEPEVTAFITDKKKKAKFVFSYAQATDQPNLILDWQQSPQLQRQIDNAWNEISKEIAGKEEGKNKENRRFYIGVDKLIQDINEDIDNSGWISTVFTSNPQTKQQWKLKNELAGIADSQKKLFATNPVQQFKAQLPPDEILRQDYGSWAVDAKKYYVAQFEQEIKYLRDETGIQSEDASAQQAINLIQSTFEKNNFNDVLQQAYEDEQNRIMFDNYETIKNELETFSKAKSKINNWLGGREVSENFVNKLANHLTDASINNTLDPRVQNSNEAIQSFIQNQLAPSENKTPEELMSEAQDRYTLENMTIQNANTSRGLGARQRQGYAYTPTGQLKEFSAFRFENGQRIEESGAELMANLDKYPELVRRTILYGINRPQQEITSYQDIGVTPLPPSLFEGIKGQGRYFEAPPTHAGTFKFDKNYIADPDLSPVSSFNFSQLPPQLPPQQPSTPLIQRNPNLDVPLTPPLPSIQRNPNLDSQFGG